MPKIINFMIFVTLQLSSLNYMHCYQILFSSFFHIGFWFGQFLELNSLFQGFILFLYVNNIGQGFSLKQNNIVLGFFCVSVQLRPGQQHIRLNLNYVIFFKLFSVDVSVFVSCLVFVYCVCFITCTTYLLSLMLICVLL